ncbi:MAG: hypothetical protein KA028_02955 [Candidatus Pacebacteria bacterium]|nr:hypothetical protein [Candidatus Paceibacterota bacterium]
MENNNKLTPKFFFLSLGMVVSLITSVTAFLSLAFETLDFKFPDVLNAAYQYGYASYNYDSARVYIATLIIFLPIFLILMRYYNKAVRAGLSHVDDVVRKWTTYLIIFLSVLVAAVDLVTLVRYFVGGEITTRFILKVLVTLLAAKWVGLYFYYTLRDSWYKKFVHAGAPWVASVLSLALIIWTFSVIGTPNQQRLWRIDDRRIQDLQSLQSQVISFWQQKQKLPATLTELADPLSYNSIPVDPEFEKGRMYTYKVTGKLTFELCATFSAEMPKGWVEYSKGGTIPYMGSGSSGRDVAVAEPAMYPGYYGGGMNQSWDHSVGEKCFSRTIDPEIYKPYYPQPAADSVVDEKMKLQ